MPDHGAFEYVYAIPAVEPPAVSSNVGLLGARPDTEKRMPRLLDSPLAIEAAGSPPKEITEFIGRVATKHKHISVARMNSPEGWHEPGQRPEFDEISLVLSGMLRVEHEAGQLDVRASQAVIAVRGEWVRYSTPEPGGAEYVAICLPAFTEESAHRDGAR